jgi:glycosyltransferase involved in cell wall biosynthesis
MASHGRQDDGALHRSSGIADHRRFCRTAYETGSTATNLGAGILRIVHVLKHGVRGNGHVHVAVDLACVQADAGHEVVFATARGSFDDLLRSHGVDVVDIPEAGGVKGAAQAAAALLALTHRFRPDVLHAHMMSSAAIGFAVSKLTRVPLLTTMHNSFEKHSVLMRLGKVVVAVSEAERRLLLSRGYRPRKVVTVVNGADNSPREAVDAEVGIGTVPKPCVMTLCGLHPRKAVHDVIAAFSKVASDFPDWHLNIVGWGAERERLEALAAELGLRDSVHFLGSTPKPRPVLEQAEIFASASLADPCPLAVAEARGAGCAIVASAVGGVPEVLEHGKAGQLVPPSDPAAMADAFRTLMADPTTLASWRARAKDGAEYFTVRRMADDYTRVYRSLSRSARATPDTAGRGSPTRVAYFVPPSKHFAGIERVVHEIASGLTGMYGDRLDVHVVFASRYDDTLLVDPPYTAHVLGVDRLRNLAKALRACVAENGFDVLVVPQVEASVIAWLATRGLGLPVFVPHLHGNPQLEEKDGTRRTRVAFGLFRHVVSHRVEGVLAVAPSLRRYAEDGVAPHATVHFAKNPVRDLGAPSAPTTPPATGERYRFVNVGRLSHQKGQDLLLRALAIARQDLPAVHLTLVGDGPEEAALRRLSSELRLDDIVTFAGYSSDPADHLRAADCFVLASRWEGFGVVLIEALQFGLPLLATNCDFGPADIIDDARIGELVASESPEALADGLRRATARTADPEDVAFRRAVAESYSRSQAAGMHLEVLREIATAAGPARSGRLAALASG